MCVIKMLFTKNSGDMEKLLWWYQWVNRDIIYDYDMIPTI